MYGGMCPYNNTCSLSSTQTGVTMIQFVLYLRYDMYNKESEQLYFHVWNHMWILFNGKPKSFSYGDALC